MNHVTKHGAALACSAEKGALACVAAFSVYHLSLNQPVVRKMHAHIRQRVLEGLTTLVCYSRLETVTQQYLHNA